MELVKGDLSQNLEVLRQQTRQLNEMACSELEGIGGDIAKRMDELSQAIAMTEQPKEKAKLEKSVKQLHVILTDIAELKMQTSKKSLAETPEWISKLVKQLKKHSNALRKSEERILSSDTLSHITGIENRLKQIKTTFSPEVIAAIVTNFKALSRSILKEGVGGGEKAPKFYKTTQKRILSLLSPIVSKVGITRLLKADEGMRLGTREFSSMNATLDHAEKWIDEKLHDNLLLRRDNPENSEDVFKAIDDVVKAMRKEVSVLHQKHAAKAPSLQHAADFDRDVSEALQRAETRIQAIRRDLVDMGDARGVTLEEGAQQLYNQTMNSVKEELRHMGSQLETLGHEKVHLNRSLHLAKKNEKPALKKSLKDLNQRIANLEKRKIDLDQLRYQGRYITPSTVVNWVEKAYSLMETTPENQLIDKAIEKRPSLRQIMADVSARRAAVLNRPHVTIEERKTVESLWTELQKMDADMVSGRISTIGKKEYVQMLALSDQLSAVERGVTRRTWMNEQRDLFQHHVGIWNDRMKEGLVKEKDRDRREVMRQHLSEVVMQAAFKFNKLLTEMPRELCEVEIPRLFPEVDRRFNETLTQVQEQMNLFDGAIRSLRRLFPVVPNLNSPTLRFSKKHYQELEGISDRAMRDLREIFLLHKGQDPSDKVNSVVKAKIEGVLTRAQKQLDKAVVRAEHQKLETIGEVITNLGSLEIRAKQLQRALEQREKVLSSHPDRSKQHAEITKAIAEAKALAKTARVMHRQAGGWQKTGSSLQQLEAWHDHELTRRHSLEKRLKALEKVGKKYHARPQAGFEQL